MWSLLALQFCFVGGYLVMGLNSLGVPMRGTVYGKLGAAFSLVWLALAWKYCRMVEHEWMLDPNLASGEAMRRAWGHARVNLGLMPFIGRLFWRDLAFDQPWPDDRGVDPSDAAYWDAYWRRELSTTWRGQPIFPLGLLLADLYIRRGARKILFVASGSSFEPHVLAELGYEVDGFDISAVVVDDLVGRPPSAEALAQLRQRAPPQLVPVGEPREYVPTRGDLMDASICPGPYDVVVCNRTLQNMRRDSRPEACQRLVDRLGPTGLLIASVHNNDTAHAHITGVLTNLVPPVQQDAPTTGRSFYLPFTSG
ncbi:MAG: class I SAM-dependent methyltransferase [Deltaproteobacteria bacterium]|nr:class I SAM-dependent methyltransferase [Deltaproteobacteria bacterium]